MTGINALFLLVGLLLFISVLASTISARLGLPLLLLFLGVVIPTVLYILWGVMEVASIPLAK